MQTSLFQWLKLVCTTHTGLGLFSSCCCELSEHMYEHMCTHLDQEDSAKKKTTNCMQQNTLKADTHDEFIHMFGMYGK